jgi:hypothetical protein
MVATAVLPLLQVPPGGLQFKVVDVAAQIDVTPPITLGNGLVVTIAVW